MKRIALEIHRDRIPPVHTNQQALLLHLPEVLAPVVDRRPDRNHQLDPHLFQLCDHGVGIRPVDRVKLPFSLQRPVEEIHDDDRDGQSALLILPCDLQKLFLRLVAQLALPEAHRVVRHHRHGAGDGRVCLLDHGGRIPRGDPVVHLLRRLRLPCRDVLPEVYAPHRRVIPQEAVAKGRNHERDTRLGIAVRQLQVHSLQVQVRLLVLAHTVDLLGRIRDKTDLQRIFIAAGKRPELPRVNPQGTRRRSVHVIFIPEILLQQKFPLLVAVFNLTDIVDNGSDLSVGDGGAERFNPDLAL